MREEGREEREGDRRGEGREEEITAVFLFGPCLVGTAKAFRNYVVIAPPGGSVRIFFSSQVRRGNGCLHPRTISASRQFPNKGLAKNYLELQFSTSKTGSNFNQGW